MKVYPILVDYPIEKIALYDTWDQVRDKALEGVKEIIGYHNNDNITDIDCDVKENGYDSFIDDLTENKATITFKITDQNGIIPVNIKDGNKIYPVSELQHLLDKIQITASYKLVTAYYPARMSEYDIRYGQPEPESWDYEDMEFTCHLSDVADVLISDCLTYPSIEELESFKKQEEQKDAGDFIR